MTVFVIQNQKWVDHKDGQLKPKFDFTPAERFGELEYLLHPSASPFNLGPVVRELHEKLANYQEGDYLLLTGNPVLIGLAVSIACMMTDGYIAMLQWSGAKRDYIPVTVQDAYDPAMESDCGN